MIKQGVTMKQILNPNKLIRQHINCPTKEDLLKAKKLINSELSDRRYNIKKYLEEKKYPNYGNFIAISFDAIFNNLSAICHLGPNYLNQIFTLSRNYQEIIVDNLWLYSFYIQNPQKAEDISERFFYIGKKNYINQLQYNINVCGKDIFFRDISIENLKIKKRELENSISGYKHRGKLSFQIKNWRGHPIYFPKNKDQDNIQWANRSKIAGDTAKDYINLKYSPFEKNLKLLSSYNHWDPMQIDEIGENNRDLLFCRTLNILLGFALDLLNIQYQIRGIKKDRPHNFVRAVNLIVYSSD